MSQQTTSAQKLSTSTPTPSQFNSLSSHSPSHAQLSHYAADPLLFISDLILPAASGEVRFGDVMAPFQRERFAALVPDLLAASRGEIPPIGRHWWEATKGASKDSDLAAATLWLLSFAARPIFGQVAAADQSQAAELRKAANDLLRSNPWLGHRVVIYRSELVCEATASRVEIISSDAAGSHGARPDWLVLNELHAIRSREFAENLMDNAEKKPNGVRVIATNAGFQNTWQWQWRQIAVDGTKGNLSDCPAESSPENRESRESRENRESRESPETRPTWFFHKFAEPAPWLSQRAIREAQRRNTASRFARLWQGVWAAGTGDALDEGAVQSCITLPGPTLKAEPNYVYLGGLDLGLKKDHSAFCVLGVHTQTGAIKLANVWSWAPPSLGGEVSVSEIEQAVMSADESYGGFFWIGFDPSQAIYLGQRLAESGLPVKEVPFSGPNLNIMARELLQAFRNQRLAIFNHRELVADLFRLSIEERTYGFRLTAVADASGHADRATALAIVLPAALESSGMITGGEFFPDGGPDDDDDNVDWRVVLD